MVNSDEIGAEVIIKSSDSIKIIQITDTHILDNSASSFNDFDTSASLLQIIESINNNEADADLILLTGDLIHEATKNAYQKLADHLSALSLPIFYLPGNHDNPELMNSIMAFNGHAAIKTFKAGQWSIILLNTCVKGEHRGELSRSELTFLRATLEMNSSSHCLIALHHHPVSIKSEWMDAMGLTNAKDFFKIIDDFEHVRGVIWGHIHQEFEIRRNNVTLLGSPSTCIQFKPMSQSFTLDEKPPAYRKLVLQDNGTLNSKAIYPGK